MSGPETRQPAGPTWRGAWFYGAVGLTAFFLLTTLAMPLNPTLLKHFNVGVESNLAALWSGMLLLLIALHAYDGWVLHRTTAPDVARAWLMIAMVLAALSLDEVGSLHERVPTFGDYSYWLTLLPFGLVLGGMLVYALVSLFRSRQQGLSARLISVSLLLFATVAMQEYIQEKSKFTGYEETLRAVVEEGTELVAMILLLKASMVNTRGRLGAMPLAHFPVFEAIKRLRPVILLGGGLAALIFAYISLYLGDHTEFSQRGQPTAWLAAALFLMTALAVLRPVLMGDKAIGWQGWLLAGVSIGACGATVISAQSPAMFPLLATFAAVAAILWYLDPRQDPRRYLPGVAFLAIIFLLAWLLRGNEFVAYCMVQFVALVFYYVGSARTVTESAGNASPLHVAGE